MNGLACFLIGVLVGAFTVIDVAIILALLEDDDDGG